MNLLKSCAEQIVPLISLSRFDEWWARVIESSLICRIWQQVCQAGSRLLSPLSPFGHALNSLSYFMVIGLFLVLPAPQFASDKEGIALLVLAGFACRIGATLLGCRQAYRPCAVDMVVLAYLGINIIASFSSHYLIESLKGVAKLSVYVVSYFLLVGVLQVSPKRRAWWMVGSLLLAGLAVSLYGLYQYKIGVAPLATWEDPTVEEKSTRIYSTLRNPNLLAGYLVPLVPIGVGSALSAFCLTGRRKIIGAALLGVSGLTAVACVLTGSRGGYLGLAAGAGAMGFILLSSFWVARPKLRPALILAVVAVPVLGALAIHQIPAVEHRILSIFAGREHSSNSYRLNVYIASWKMFLDSWWIGVGTGNQAFQAAYGLYMRSGFDALGTYCVPLEVAVECGIGGVVIFFALLAAILARAHQFFWAQRTMPARWLVAGAAAGLWGMMVHGLVDTVYYRPQVQLIFWLIAALCVAFHVVFAKQTASEPSKEEPSRDKGSIAP